MEVKVLSNSSAILKEWGNDRITRRIMWECVWKSLGRSASDEVIDLENHYLKKTKVWIFDKQGEYYMTGINGKSLNGTVLGHSQGDEHLTLKKL